MTTKTVMTLTEAQLRTLRVAMETFLAVSAHADSRSTEASHQFARRTMTDAHDAVRWDPLRIRADHQSARDLLELLELAESVELSATDTTADDGEDDEPIGFEAAFVDAAASAHCRM